MEIHELEHKTAEELRDMVKEMLGASRLNTDVRYYDARFNYYLSLGFLQKEAFNRVEAEFSKYFDGYVYKNYESYRQGRRKRISSGI